MPEGSPGQARVLAWLHDSVSLWGWHHHPSFPTLPSHLSESAAAFCPLRGCQPPVLFLISSSCSLSPLNDGGEITAIKASPFSPHPLMACPRGTINTRHQPILASHRQAWGLQPPQRPFAISHPGAISHRPGPWVRPPRKPSTGT